MHDLVTQTKIARDTESKLAMPIGITGTVGGDAKRLITKRLSGRPREAGAVNATAEGDNCGVETV